MSLGHHVNIEHAVSLLDKEPLEDEGVCEMNVEDQAGFKQCRRKAVPKTEYLRHLYEENFGLCASCQYGCIVMHEEIDRDAEEDDQKEMDEHDKAL